MSDKPIKQLILYFPSGATVEDCGYIAHKVEGVVNLGVSSGGFLPTNKYGLNVDNVTFSEDTMMYEYGYERNLKGGKDE